MALIDLYSQRIARERGEVNDVYTYDPIPTRLRIQMCHVIGDSLGNAQEYLSNERVMDAYKFIVLGLCREYGLFRLANQSTRSRNHREELLTYLQTADTSEFLDTVQLSCQVIDRIVSRGDYRFISSFVARQNASDALDELNARFRQNSVGYRFESGILVRIDSDFIHAEIVKPVIALLRDERFAGAQQEFLSAHEHYRHGRTKEAIADCVKALESTLKSIGGIKEWTIPPNATAAPLVNLVLEKGLIPAFWQSHFSGLRTMLVDGAPTARNRVAGHGQGTDPVEVPTHIAAFALHQTAAAIVFLVHSMNAMDD